ncbi:MAG: Hsp20/alpha crystallin family protein [Bacteroidales bacterium]
MLPLVQRKSYYPYSSNQLLSSLFSDGADYSVPAVNIKKNEKSYDIEVAAPGLSKSDFTIKVEKDVLTVSSEIEVKNEEKNEEFMRKEFGFKSFSRSFSIPETVDVEKINASYKNGVLNIKLPKLDEALVKQTREIKIS